MGRLWSSGRGLLRRLFVAVTAFSRRPQGPHLVTPSGVVGPIRLFESRSSVGRRLGERGTVVVQRPERGTTQDVVVTRVRYEDASLEITYLSSPKYPDGLAYLISTSDPRYRTRDGIGVGSTFRQVRSVDGVRCFNERGEDYADCQVGLGHEHPLVVFDVRAGKVALVAAYGAAD